MKPLNILAITASSAAGIGMEEHYRALVEGQIGLKNQQFYDAEHLDTWIGEVSAVNNISLPPVFRDYDCRNNHLAYFALQQDGFLSKVEQAVQRYGAHRVGLFMGTSTSGIHETELAYQRAAMTDWNLSKDYHYETTHNNFSITRFVSELTGAQGIGHTISTACSSSAKAFVSAYRAIELGLCDVAIVGGVDSLCLTTLYGFHSLQLLSSNVCRPADAERDGINIGEAAVFALVGFEGDADICLRGYGESSDAYHMSSPHPDGEGARTAMEDALTRAELKPQDIDYINLHGTGTRSNDSAEARAVVSLFGQSLPCSSTKGWTGHTLGAAGALEAAISYLCLQQQFIPASQNTLNIDPDITCNIVTQTGKENLHYVLTNSFGFGGNNCSLVFGH